MGLGLIEWCHRTFPVPLYKAKVLFHLKYFGFDGCSTAAFGTDSPAAAADTCQLAVEISLVNPLSAMVPDSFALSSIRPVPS